jgi:starch synthase
MNVLFVSAEADPFAKVGGLADIIGSLPKALRAAPHAIDARVIMPLYGFLDTAHYHITPLLTFQLPRPTGTTDVTLFTTTFEGVPFYFVQGWPFFGIEHTVYSDFDHDVPRFIFFCQAVLAACDELRARLGWFPDVLHVHDWHTGLVPFLASARRASEPAWADIATVLSIHNLAYQGEQIGGWLWQLGIPARHHPDLEYRGLTDNMLAISIAYSDMLSTVSPRYATEIQYQYMGYGLDGLIRARIDRLYGILNGLDVDVWNPQTDTQIVSPFNADTFRERRPPNKAQLQRDAGLPVAPDVLVIGMVTRLVWQKGIDLAIPALRYLLAGFDVQFIGLGSGEPEYNDALARLSSDFYWKSRSFIGYNAAVAQRIYAGCDLFLMPSHYEPCGVGQMIAMRYGALPLVRETGGLADTVSNYDGGDADTGTGFVFHWETDEALYGTLKWALETYHTRPHAWQRMQERAMRTDLSWTRSAAEYVRLYQRARTVEKVTPL